MISSPYSVLHHATLRLAGLALLAVISSTGCGPESDSWAAGKGGPHAKGGHGGKGKGGKKALAVATTTLKAADIERHYRTSGTLKALRSAELVPVQLGIIKSLSAEEGETVKQGEVIAKLDGRELALQAASAKLQLENLRRELDRLEAAQDVISAEEIDKQRYAVEEAKASAKLSQHQAKQTVIRAPFDATVVERFVDVGNLATTATSVYAIADLSQLELELHVPEKDAATVKDEAEVEVELVDGSTFGAAIARRAPIVDEVTGTVKFTVRAKEFPKTAMPGAFARAQVLVDARTAVPSIPLSAVFEVEGAPHVYVVTDGKAKRVSVKLGLEGTERVEVLEGLGDADEVVQDGNAGITEGMPLRAAESPPTAADAKTP